MDLGQEVEEAEMMTEADRPQAFEPKSSLAGSPQSLIIERQLLDTAQDAGARARTASREAAPTHPVGMARARMQTKGKAAR